MSQLSDQIKRQVRQRAKNRCEYCLSQQKYVLGRLQVDHIHPKGRGGSDELDNLCLACELCNQYKWAKIEGFDIQTDALHPLFNPRQQKWADHFSWGGDQAEIIGLTAWGRATVEALHLNNELAVTVRRNWVKAGWHPPSD